MKIGRYSSHSPLNLENTRNSNLGDGDVKSFVAILGAKGNKPEMVKQEKAAQDMEGLLIKQMLTEMWQTIPREETSNERDLIEDLYLERMSEHLAGKFGIKEVILKELHQK